MSHPHSCFPASCPNEPVGAGKQLWGKLCQLPALISYWGSCQQDLSWVGNPYPAGAGRELSHQLVASPWLSGDSLPNQGLAASCPTSGTASSARKQRAPQSRRCSAPVGTQDLQSARTGGGSAPRFLPVSVCMSATAQWVHLHVTLLQHSNTLQ